MGESFLGLPNRFKIINNLLESDYNPNHMLSAYQGYRLSNDYVNRNGGEEYSMSGNLYTRSVLPTENADYGNYGTLYGSDLGSYYNQYRYVYAKYIYGTAESASKLNHKINLNVTGAVTGSVSLDCSGNIDLELVSSHNHDDKYLPLTGGSVTGNIKFNGYSIGLLNKNGRQMLAEDNSNVLHIGRGDYNNGAGNIDLYSSYYMNLRTKQDSIRLWIESNEQGLIKPYVSIGADTTGAFVKYSKNASRLYLGSDNLTYNGYTVYHTGNLKLSDIGAASTNHTHDYLPLSGGVLTGVLNMKPSTGAGMIQLYYNGNTAGFIEAVNNGIQLYPTYNNSGSVGTYNNRFSSMYASTFYGSLSGNASSATRLTTARTLTIGNSGKSFDGSSNVSWSLSEIGAATIGHTHEYIPITNKFTADAVTSTNYPTNGDNIPTLNFISYWNGTYSSDGSSNLAYCNKGEFGTIVTKNVEDFLASSGSVSLKGSLTIGTSSSDVLKVLKINPIKDRACVRISRTGNQLIDGQAVGQFLDAAIDDLASDRIIATSILTGVNSGSNGNITIGIDKYGTTTNKGLHVKYVETNVTITGKDLNDSIGAAYKTGNYANVYCGELVSNSTVHGKKGTFSDTVSAKGFTTTSDIRLKKDISLIDIYQSIRILSKLTPVSYKYTDDEITNRGFIAQQLKEIMDEEKCNSQIYRKLKNGNMCISYTQLIPDIINVLKYLLYKVDGDLFNDIAKSLEFDEEYYREHAEEIANR